MDTDKIYKFAENFGNIMGGSTGEPRTVHDNILFWGLAIPMILITILYHTGTITNIPCDNNILSNAARNFIHVDTMHIIGNLSVFFILSHELVKTFGFKYVLILLLSLLIIIVIIDTIYLKLVPDQRCSIGFSGILYGMLVWNILSKSSITASSLISIGILVLFPSMTSSNVSLSGHLIGAGAGLVTYFVAGNKINL